MSKSDTSKYANPKFLAQDILSRRSHTEYELTIKLKKKGVKQQDIEETLNWLGEKKYIDDEETAQQYIEQTLRRKAVGPMWIKSKLRQKGIDVDVINTAIESNYPDKQEVKERAITAWKKSHSKHADDKIRLQRFLISRGF